MMQKQSATELPLRPHEIGQAPFFLIRRHLKAAFAPLFPRLPEGWATAPVEHFALQVLHQVKARGYYYQLFRGTLPDEKCCLLLPLAGGPSHSGKGLTLEEAILRACALAALHLTNAGTALSSPTHR